MSLWHLDFFGICLIVGQSADEVLEKLHWCCLSKESFVEISGWSWDLHFNIDFLERVGHREISLEDLAIFDLSFEIIRYIVVPQDCRD